MAYNHLRILHRHHLHWHGDKIFPYFDFENMKFVKDRIKGITKTMMDKIKAKTKEAMAAKIKSLLKKHYHVPTLEGGVSFNCQYT